jgi:ABC-type branched-subunit amino acid transport system substrate-binding protein
MSIRTSGVVRRHRTATALAVLTAAALALTACGGGSDSGSGSGSGSGSSDTISIGGTVSLTSPAASFPEVKQAQDAAVASINAAGGINGKQLKLTVCDSKFEVNAELGCFRSLLQSKVSAIVGPVLIAGTGVGEYKAAEQAKTAVIGSPAYQPGELVSSASFPLGPSVVGGTYGAIYDLLKNGAKNISIFGDANNPAANSIVQLSKQALSSINKQPVNVVVGDASTDPTLQSAAAKAIANGTDGIIITGAPPSMAKSVPALRAQGYKGLIATIDGALPGPVVTAIASSAEGMLVASQTAFPEQSPASAEFLADMKKYAPDAPLSFFSIQAWSSIKLFAAVATQAKATTNEEVLNAFQNLSTAVDIKTLAPYKVAGVTSPITDGFEPAPRMFNQQVQLGTMQGGKFVASGGYIDPFAALKSIG